MTASTQDDIQFGDLELREQIGEGNFALVFRGLCRGTPVAVKQLKATAASINRDAVEQFQKEVEVMRNARHRNVCLLMGTSISDQGYFLIIMEYVEGSVDKLVFSDSGISYIDRLYIAAQAARGMAWLHRATPKIIHRDLKLSNLLYDINHVVKVCDFGLSQLLPEKHALIDQGWAKGTPLYMAPEVMKGEKFTEKIDVYSFALILWELITRKRVFSDKSYNVTEFVHAITHNVRPPTNDFQPRVVTLLNRMWNSSPIERPSFNDILVELVEINLECIPDDCARLIWRQTYIDKDYYLLPVLDLEKMIASVTRHQLLINHFAGAVTKESKLTENCLHRALMEQRIDSEHISIEKFIRFVLFYGLINEETITNIMNLFRSGWFYGPITSEDADSKVKSGHQKCFLIRFGSEMNGSYALHIMRNKPVKFKVSRIIINGKVNYTFLSENYPSLFALVETLQKRGEISTPCLGSMYDHLFDFNSEDLSGYENGLESGVMNVEH